MVCIRPNERSRLRSPLETFHRLKLAGEVIRLTFDELSFAGSSGWQSCCDIQSLAGFRVVFIGGVNFDPGLTAGAADRLSNSSV